MKLGAHVSTAQPFSEAINRAAALGCECMQIFANPPQRWNPVPVKTDEVDKFLDYNAKQQISPIFIHGIYLINLASENPYFLEASINSLVDDMNKAKELNANGVIFHLGSTRGRKLSEVLGQVGEAVEKILLLAPEGPDLIFENSAGSGDVLGDTFEELAEIIAQVNSSRLKVALDTAHLFESGYEIQSERGLNETLDKFDNLIGLNRLVCLHLNDSKTAFASHRDRHADIGEGFIGEKAFHNILNHPKLKDLPGIIETPSLKGKGDIDNLALLKKMRQA